MGGRPHCFKKIGWGGQEMICNICGDMIPDGSDYCNSCGADLRQFKKIQSPMGDVNPSEAPMDEAKPTETPVNEMKPMEAADMNQNAGSAIVDIPLANPDPASEYDAESGTTVLTAADLGLDFPQPQSAESSNVISPNAEPQFSEVDAPKSEQSQVPEFKNEPQAQAPVQPVMPEAPVQPEMPQAQAPAQPVMPEAPVMPETPVQPEMPQPEVREKLEKVVTPAPVTGSSILSNENVAPVTPVVPAQNVSSNYGQNMEQTQNTNMNQQYGGYYGGYDNSYMQGAPQGMNQGYNPGFGGNIPEEYKPISPWGYVGYSLLFSIPIAGLVMLFVFAFGDGNMNLKNYARGTLILAAIGVGLSILMFILAAVFGLSVFSALY